jgi:hypothetical protein
VKNKGKRVGIIAQLAQDPEFKLSTEKEKKKLD